MSRLGQVTLGLAAASLCVSAPAFAQKAKDEMRLAINDMFPTVDPYVFPLDEAGVWYRILYQPLAAFTESDQKFVPAIAKSWTIPQPGVYEFELRDDIYFHSGNKLTADDVVYTLNFFADPKQKIRFKARYDWFKPVEKLGEYKVRITAKDPSPADMATLAYRSRIFDKAILSKMEDHYEDYGRVSGSGTGPYRLVSIDKQKVIFEKYPGVRDGYQRAAVGRYVGIHIPDEQSQIAQIMTGGVDALRNISPDNARMIGERPGMAIADLNSGDEIYITLDAAGRSKSKVMTDQRVRKALMMAINRDELIKHIIPGHGTAVKLNSICFDWTVDCAMSTTPPAYDPEGAKKLLAEAGYPNGFDLEFNVHEPIREIGEAIAGELRKVGIRASVAALPLAVYVKKRGEGEFTAFNGFYPTGAQPDAGNLYDFFFGADRDYYQDETIHALAKKAQVEYDKDKRTALYKQMVDRVNTMNYILPVASLPTAYAMTKEVKIMPDAFSYAGVYLNDLVWDDYKGK